MFCHYQNQEEKAPGKRALGTKESSCREPPFENLPISQCVQKDSTSGDVCNRVTEFKYLVVCRFEELRGVAEASCVALSILSDHTPPLKGSHGCEGQCLAHPPGQATAVNLLGFCRGQCQPLSSLLRSRLGLSLLLILITGEMSACITNGTSSLVKDFR